MTLQFNTSAGPVVTAVSVAPVSLGEVLRLSLQRFDARVLTLMAQHVALPLALSNLARRGQVTSAHIHLTRHLPLDDAGLRPSQLAQRAGVSKQAIGKAVDECAAWGLVARDADTQDARSQRVVWTATGRLWRASYEQALHTAQAEFALDVGDPIATVVLLGLEAYAQITAAQGV